MPSWCESIEKLMKSWVIVDGNLDTILELGRFYGTAIYYSSGNCDAELRIRHNTVLQPHVQCLNAVAIFRRSKYGRPQK